MGRIIVSLKDLSWVKNESKSPWKWSSFWRNFLVKKWSKKRIFIIIIPTLLRIVPSSKKVQSRSIEALACFKSSEGFDLLMIHTFYEFAMILLTTFCSRKSSKIQEKAENMKKRKSQMPPQSWKTKQLKKQLETAQNLQKLLFFDKTGRVYPSFSWFSLLFWANFAVKSAVFCILTKNAEIRAKFEKSRKKYFFLKFDRWVIPRFFREIFF